MKRIFALCLCLLLLTGCGTAVGEAASTTVVPARTITDGADRQVKVPEVVERVVCVGVGALRYTCYMESADRVVGVEDYEQKESIHSLYNYVNYEKFKDLPAIGTNGEPNAEAIIAADPQVIVMSAYASADADALQDKTGIPVVVVPGSDTALDGKCYETIEILGQLYGKTDRAEALTAYLETLRRDLATYPLSSKSYAPSVYVAGVSFKGQHGFEGTEAGYAPLALIGANNLADTTGQTGAFNLDLEQVLTWDPDYIFLDYTGLPLIQEAYAENPDYFQALTAVREGRVYSQIAFRNYAVNLETALADSYYAATILYPEAFVSPDPEAKAREIFTQLLGADPYDDLKEAGYAFSALTLGAQ